MPRQAMIIDLDRCVGCGACVMACQEEWSLPATVRRNWVEPLLPVPGKGPPLYTHYVGLCNHCAKAPCVGACPTGASYRDAQGRVRIDASACISCGYCVTACPYDARMLRPGGGIEKCDFCAETVDAGNEPACVRTCPAGARIFGDLDDSRSAVSRHFRTQPVRRLETRQVAVGPKVLYAGNPRAVDRILAEHPPQPAGLHPPLPGRVFRSAARPAFLGLLALAAVGILASLVRVLRRREPSPQTTPGADAEPTVQRHRSSVMALHWFNAAVWGFQSLTGFALLGRSDYRVLPEWMYAATLRLFGSHGALLHAHLVVGGIWALVLLLFAILGFRSQLRPALRALRLRRDDLRWLRVRLGNLTSRSPDALPPQDKLNAGQKLCGILVAGATVALILTGLILGVPHRGTLLVQWAVLLHFVAAAGVMVTLVVHVFMALAVPAERPVLWSMFTGRVPVSYAQEHCARWLDETQKKRKKKEG